MNAKNQENKIIANAKVTYSINCFTNMYGDDEAIQIVLNINFSNLESNNNQTEIAIVL